MITIRQALMEKKNQEIWTVPPDATLKDALKLMAEKEVGSVLVMDGEKVVGIFTERDFARRALASESLCLSDPVSSVMTGKVFYMGPDQTIDECMALMTQKRFRHVPVLEGGKLVGVISIGDVVKSLIIDRDITIQGLENFILGREYSG